jgi:hypothetical protein
MGFAADYDELFRGVYLRFHRRDAKRDELPGARAARRPYCQYCVDSLGKLQPFDCGAYCGNGCDG